MRTLLSSIATLLIVAETGVGCGGDGGAGPGESFTVEATPAAATLFTVAPGNAVKLSVVAMDQDGQPVVADGPATFSSSNDAIADVSDDGTITAVAAGTARITAALIVSGVAKTGTTTVTALVAPMNATVVAPATAFLPATVDIGTGGRVTWTFGPNGHQVTFTTPGAPSDIPEFQNGSRALTFLNHGTFNYQCSGPQMAGVVRVH